MCYAIFMIHACEIEIFLAIVVVIITLYVARTIMQY